MYEIGVNHVAGHRGRDALISSTNPFKKSIYLILGRGKIRVKVSVRKIEKTDWLIDQVAFWLYGCSEEEKYKPLDNSTRFTLSFKKAEVKGIGSAHLIKTKANFTPFY